MAAFVSKSTPQSARLMPEEWLVLFGLWLVGACLALLLSDNGMAAGWTNLLLGLLLFLSVFYFMLGGQYSDATIFLAGSAGVALIALMCFAYAKLPAEAIVAAALMIISIWLITVHFKKKYPGPAHG